MPPAGARGSVGGVDESERGGSSNALVSGLLKPSFDTAGTLGSGFLSVQTVVMAASFASSIPPLSLQPLMRWVSSVKGSLGQKRGSLPSRVPPPDVEDGAGEHRGVLDAHEGDSQGVPLVYRPQDEGVLPASGVVQEGSPGVLGLQEEDSGAKGAPAASVKTAVADPDTTGHAATHSSGPCPSWRSSQRFPAHSFFAH